MSVRAGRFCDFNKNKTSTDPCPLPAVGTCALCAMDYCSNHSTADRALSVAVSISRRTPGSGALHTTKIVEENGEMCESCTSAFISDGGLQRETVQAACAAAVQALAAAQSAKALATEPEPNTP